MLQQAARLIQPRVLVVTGGEPLLHPDLPDIIKAVCSSFNCEIELVSNGIELEHSKHGESLLDLHAKLPLTFVISEHCDVSNTISWLKKNKLRYRLIPKTLFRILPVSRRTTDPAVAFKDCPSPGHPALLGSKLHRCCVHSGRAALYKYGLKGAAKISGDYAKRIEPANGIDLSSISVCDLYCHLIETPYYECSLCPEKIVYEPNTQLTDAELNEIIDNISS
jgi:hypothetical protein